MRDAVSRNTQRWFSFTQTWNGRLTSAKMCFSVIPRMYLHAGAAAVGAARFVM